MSMNILDSNRQNTPQLPPEEFLRSFPGSRLQYFDESPEKNATKAASVTRFDPQEAERKQAQGCGVYFSPNAFGEARRIEHLRSVQALYIDKDCAKEGDGSTAEQIELRKAESFADLLSAKCPPHIINDTKNGLQAIWLIEPQKGREAIRLFAEVETMLINRFQADPGAKDVTRVLRLPGFYHLKDQNAPYLIRILHLNLP